MARSRTLDEFTKPTGTVIGEGVTVHSARFSSDAGESMRIDGTLIGDVEIGGVLNVSDTGHVDGNINAGFARIAGRVTGNIQCKNALHLTTTADVVGDILTTTLIIDDGAVLLGRCQTNTSVSGEVVGAIGVTYS